MAVVMNGIVRLNGVVIGKVAGIKDGTVIDVSYDRKTVIEL